MLGHSKQYIFIFTSYALLFKVCGQYDVFILLYEINTLFSKDA